MLYREIIAVCSQIHTKHINTVCGQNLELLNVKPGLLKETTKLSRVNDNFKLSFIRLLLAVLLPVKYFRSP
jgi:hypothetical protein